MSNTGLKLLGRGMYSPTEASRLTRVPIRRINRWTRGYWFMHRGKRQTRGKDFLNTLHPFSSDRFRIVGRTILAVVTDEAGDRQLLDLVQNQWVFDKLVMDTLRTIAFPLTSPMREIWRQSGLTSFFFGGGFSELSIWRQVCEFCRERIETLPVRLEILHTTPAAGLAVWLGCVRPGKAPDVVRA